MEKTQEERIAAYHARANTPPSDPDEREAWEIDQINTWASSYE